jgi:hypothetical protein
MDLLNLIKAKCKAFINTDFYQGIDAVIHHIEVAEKHFEKGKSYGEYLYTDVIYRTNQAFEGAMKEAYRVFTGNDPSQKSPYQIEQYLENNKLLKERVLAQFTNYRTEWRNKSTHDYQLFFSSQEALLAIVSISAFFSILLDQMLEKYAHELEKQKLSKESYSLFKQVKNYDQLNFMQQCVELLTHFAASLKRDLKPTSKVLSEYEVLGKLSGFIASSDPEIKITTEKPIRIGSMRMVLDLLLEKDNKSVIVELKRPSSEWARRVREGVEQVKSYLAATGLTEGIVFVPPLNDKSSITVQSKTFELNERPLNVAVISPGNA